MGSAFGKNHTVIFFADAISSQVDKVFLVTGANTGLGFETCKVLASKGATVVMTIRDRKRSQNAIASVEKIAAENGGNVRAIEMDLADLSTIEKAAEEFKEMKLPIHCLINNAGVMMCPKSFTKDGLEMQMGTNHFGHFALTAQLFPVLRKTAEIAPDVRIVNLTSSFHSKGPKEGILFDNLKWDENKTPKYDPSLAYGQSKFANVVFTKELNDRLRANGLNNIITNAVHPGFVDTNLTRHIESRKSRIAVRFFKWISGALNVREGALTQLYVATSPEIIEKQYRAEYFVPIATRRDLDSTTPKISKEMQQKLWEVSEELTKTKFEL